jgi:SanA protein
VLTWLCSFKKYGGGWLLAGLVLPGLLVAWRVWLNLAYATATFTAIADVPPHRVALVFGAGVRNNRPSAALADRIEAAAALYQAGRVQKLLMSGDNRFVNYNEPGVMQAYAQALGVPAQDIVLDYAGRRTYDSCYRARAIFQVTEAVLVTQGFHQARAAYLCDRLGVRSVGLVADKRYYLRRLRLWWEVRETLASAIAWWDVNVARPTPVLGEVIPIGN